MRISDWSSDVCSSDLRSLFSGRSRGERNHRRDDRNPGVRNDDCTLRQHARQSACPQGRYGNWRSDPDGDPGPQIGGGLRPYRSEEHTSELQSLMRISYAVFCLKKKTITDINYNSQFSNVTTV